MPVEMSTGASTWRCYLESSSRTRQRHSLGAGPAFPLQLHPRAINARAFCGYQKAWMAMMTVTLFIIIPNDKQHKCHQKRSTRVPAGIPMLYTMVYKNANEWTTATRHMDKAGESRGEEKRPGAKNTCWTNPFTPSPQTSKTHQWGQPSGDSGVPFGEEPERGHLGCQRVLDPDWTTVTRVRWLFDISSLVHLGFTWFSFRLPPSPSLPKHKKIHKTPKSKPGF